jgi:hypothetical protein
MTSWNRRQPGRMARLPQLAACGGRSVRRRLPPEAGPRAHYRCGHRNPACSIAPTTWPLCCGQGRGRGQDSARGAVCASGGREVSRRAAVRGLAGLCRSRRSGSPAEAIRACSYQNLSEHAARAFRLLGLHPGPDITASAAASLLALPLGRSRALLAELASWNLVSEHRPGRFALHDLLRAYAAESAAVQDSDEQRHAAAHRVLDHYLHTAHAAAKVLNPHRGAIALKPAQPGVAPERAADHEQAMAWFDAERAVLLAAGPAWRTRRRAGRRDRPRRHRLYTAPPWPLPRSRRRLPQGNRDVQET